MTAAWGLLEGGKIIGVSTRDMSGSAGWVPLALAGTPEDLAELEHEARMMRARMDRLQGERDGLVRAIIARLESACGRGSMPPTLIAEEFL